MLMSSTPGFSQMIALVCAASRDRTARTCLLAALMAVLVGAGRMRLADRNFDRYYLEKTTWQACADVVLAGDSRVHIGVSPEVMAANLNQAAVRNFAFNGTGYTQEYLDRVEQVLSDHGDARTIILGVTPRSLTPEAAANNGFKHFTGRASTWELMKHRHFDAILQFFAPLNLVELQQTITPRVTARHFTVQMYDDGWKAVGVDDRRTQLDLHGHREFYLRQKVDPRAIANVLAAVTKWASAGVNVYGFRPPSCTEMVRLEDELSGFDEREFATAFGNAGGMWLRVSNLDYCCYDGSHLERISAERFSRDLAIRINAMQTRIARGRSRPGS